MPGGKENVIPDGEGLPAPARDKATEIINEIMANGRWGAVKGSAIVLQGNNMWELRIHFNDDMTRRVRISGDGSVTSDNTAPTRTLQ